MKKQFRLLALLFSLLFVLTSCALPGAGTGTGSTPASSVTEGNGATPLPSGAQFEVHFIDVGQADAALILCDGKAMMIDGGNAADSSLVYTYLKKRGITHIDYMICTHAHEDHVGGLPGALRAATVGVAMAPVTEYDSRAFRNYVSAVENQGKTLTVPQAGDRFSLGSTEVTVLGPVREYTETNNTSIVLRVVFGSLSFLFTGDMERDAEADLLDAGVSVASTVLKVGHHGSNTSTSYRFLREVDPTYAVISVGKDNSYGHPNEEPLSRLRDADVTLYRTDLQGDIVCRSNDGKTLTFQTSKNSSVPTNPTEDSRTESDTAAASEYAFVGNAETKKYHRLTCSSLPAEDKRCYFITEEEAQRAGYTACKRCLP